MALVKNGIESKNMWVHIGDDSPLPDGGLFTLPLPRWLAQAAARQSERTIPPGVRLQPADDPVQLEPLIGALKLVEIVFPAFTDGRGYSQAQILRRRLGYDGELRAVGQVLVDQVFYMHRSGIDAYQIDNACLPDVSRALQDCPVVYQPASDSRRPAFVSRHKKT